MNKNFNEWYIENDIILTEEKQLAKRWDGVEAFSKNPKREDIDKLALLFFGFDVEERYINEFCKIFKEHDEFFSSRSNIEIRLLTGAILLNIAESSRQYDSYIELLTKCASFVKGRAFNQNILIEIDKQFRTDSEELRNEVSLKKGKVEVAGALAFKKKLMDYTWDEATYQLFATFIDEISTSFKEIDKVVDSAKNIHDLRVEESQILWWLTSGWNGVKECMYKTMRKEEACFYIGYELSQFITMYPGPYPATSIILRVLDQCKGTRGELSFAELVQLFPVQLTEDILRLCEGKRNLRLFPLISAIKSAQNTKSVAEWKSKYAIEFNCSAIVDTKIPYLQIAEQLYFEILTLRCYETIKE